MQVPSAVDMLVHPLVSVQDEGVVAMVWELGPVMAGRDDAWPAAGSWATCSFSPARAAAGGVWCAPVMMCIPKIPATMARTPTSTLKRRRNTPKLLNTAAVMVFLLPFRVVVFKPTGSLWAFNEPRTG